jgi:Fe-S cluster biogenesis protein NfuA
MRLALRRLVLMEEVVKAIVEDLRQIFQVNGADLEAREITQDLVRVAVIFGPAACHECLLPSDRIEETLAGLVKARVGHDVKVIVEEVNQEVRSHAS